MSIGMRLMGKMPMLRFSCAFSGPRGRWRIAGGEPAPQGRSEPPECGPIEAEPRRGDGSMRRELGNPPSPRRGSLCLEQASGGLRVRSPPAIRRRPFGPSLFFLGDRPHRWGSCPTWSRHRPRGNHLGCVLRRHELGTQYRRIRPSKADQNETIRCPRISAHGGRLWNCVPEFRPPNSATYRALTGGADLRPCGQIHCAI